VGAAIGASSSRLRRLKRLAIHLQFRQRAILCYHLSHCFASCAIMLLVSTGALAGVVAVFMRVCQHEPQSLETGQDCVATCATWLMDVASHQPIACAGWEVYWPVLAGKCTCQPIACAGWEVYLSQCR
jgi:hypothetical protein